MIRDLKILNGNLDLKFNNYIYEYTVSVDDNINSLEFSYKLDDNCNVNIRDNILESGENTVYLDVYNIDSTITYTFLVYKGNTNYTIGIDNYRKSLEVNNEVGVEIYKLQLLSIGIFLALIIVFSIIFHRKKTIY